MRINIRKCIRGIVFYSFLLLCFYGAYHVGYCAAKDIKPDLRLFLFPIGFAGASIAWFEELKN